MKLIAPTLAALATAAAAALVAGIAGAAGIPGAAGAITVPPPPPTRSQPVQEVVDGVRIVDDYRWLEGNSDPKAMGAMTPEVAAWTEAQNAYTRSILDHLPGRRELEARLRPLMQVGAVSLPFMRGDRYVYLKREGNQNQASVFLRQGYRGAPRLLLDPAKLDPSGLTTISWTAPSQDGRLLAYGTFRSGDERSTLHILEVDSGRTLPLTIGNKTSSFDWLPDASGFFYRNLADIEDPYSGQVKFHRMGSDPASDRLVMRQLTAQEDAKLAHTYGPQMSLSKDGRWLLLSYATGASTNDAWYADARRFAATGELVKVPLSVGEDGQSDGIAVGDTLYLHSTVGAPNGQVFAVDLSHPDRARERASWKLLVPERKDATIESVTAGRGVIAVHVLVAAHDRYELYSPAGKPLGELKLPGIGSAGLSADEDRTEAYLQFTSFNYPSTIFRVDLAHPAAPPELWERPAVPVDPSTVEVEQVWYPSKDGTRVSMFIAHRKGLRRDGGNPTLLTGYGGFDISMKPSFNATLFQWFEAGGVFALPNLRGGGEYGEAWHQAGMLAKKQNVFDDFIAAAEYLVASGYTRREKLAIEGGSNGGLLTGAALTQRPDLFAAVISAVPLLDMVRYQNFLMARYWVTEYGSSEDRSQMPFLYAYSPYHHVKAGTRYPAVLLTAAENDARVHPLHARKMTAALRAADAADQSREPILLWVEREAGHGSGKPLSLRLRDTADQRIFLMWQLGMLGEATQRSR
jgi:prolyl oligopeptidase